MDHGDHSEARCQNTDKQLVENVLLVEQLQLTNFCTLVIYILFYLLQGFAGGKKSYCECTFSPIAMLKSIKIFHTKTIHLDYVVGHVDRDNDEILAALKSCDDNKAPGPDGFNMFFYKQCWFLLKDDIQQLYKVFFERGTFPHALNTAFVVLIPKFKGANNIKDFRPISLINGVFKILSKLLANRLAPILPALISENQFGFIKGRSIHDCHSIATEVVNLCCNRREKTLLIKLDFHKAFDSVSWLFILKILEEMHFDTTWIQWIKSLLGSSQLSVLINGSPSDNFYMEKGVRQGDPLSPMLFVIAAEGFKAIIEKAKHEGLLEGIRIDGYHESISLLQFADDTLMFLPYDLDKVRNLLRILRCFEIVSGLRINFNKSSVIGLNLVEEEVLAAADILNCKVESLPITYLGLPLSRKNLALNQYAPLVQNFQNHLAQWKGNLLSPAGRLVLIKSVLSSLPVYSMCCYDIPVHVIKALESSMRNFLWKGSSSSRCSLWYLVVRESSHLSSWFDLINPRNKHLSVLWRGVRKLCLNNGDIWELFRDNIMFTVGNGRHVRFWHDKWLRNQQVTLSIGYPRLFNLSLHPDAMIADLFQAAYNEQQWEGTKLIGRKLVKHIQQLLLTDANLKRIGVQQLSSGKRILVYCIRIRLLIQVCRIVFLSDCGTRKYLLACNFSRGCCTKTESLRRVSCIREGYYRMIKLVACSVRFLKLMAIMWLFIVIKRGLFGVVAWSIPANTSSFYFQWMELAKFNFKDLWSTIWFFGIWEFWKARNKRVFQNEASDYEDLVLICIVKGVNHYKFHNPNFSYSANDVFRSINFFSRS
ncbi:uncharacterized protein LOC126668601 [Mercurialis annua]|uniref:uncharacterized protein LOC126668601 n=1 Tax=Mercurialis annua TaxID=3986 RepID=UPI0021606976|nr:uncharacterized protein LOC126668601 [Mercurialis annua]